MPHRIAHAKAYPFEILDRGDLPTLKSLMVHNGTVYRWNRPCYGWSNGQAHLRIENRVLPAGPTVLDEMANAAFFFGLMAGVSSEIQDEGVRHAVYEVGPDGEVLNRFMRHPETYTRWARRPSSRTVTGRSRSPARSSST